MLTSLGTPDIKVAGFDVYVFKPFDYRELLARVNVFPGRSDPVNRDKKLRIADLEMDLDTKTVARSQKESN